ncbi:PREDICTED: uncharacterized protein LOC109583339 [Amphimedon queenslandica]|uniref:Uncharacterized protein n=1 Tax=Amphimedon queenslandica TaxID=400682 RepID=A0A1X7UI17_AMPQE|nr:PREDICTED: uncharacterized protein LOC109583339 [Amphimedon queenslandica]|eukprot:XP_019854197.1 PREDICTED: uncharacterized protein LOC109583339 [Amphimedon queenslandica]
MAPSTTCIYLLILLLVGALVPFSQSASLGSGETVSPSSVEEIEQSSTAGITASPSPSPVLMERKASLSGTLEMQRDLQLLTLPESKYVHAVQLSEGSYSLASNGDPNQDTVFTIERYANGGTGPSHYYKMRRRETLEYAYVSDNGRILIGEETASKVPAVFERVEHNVESFTFINLIQLNSDGSRTSCYIGFNSDFQAVCSSEQEKQYLLENVPHNNIG